MADSDKDRNAEAEERWDRAEKKVREMEEGDPPKNLEDWPSDEAKYVTFGGTEGDHSYEEGPERKLGPSSLERHADGSITIEGEQVDNPEDYKADEPIKGATQSME